MILIIFLKRILLKDWVPLFFNTFSQNNNKEMLYLLNKALEIVNLDITKTYIVDNKNIDISWLNASWHSKGNTHFIKNGNNNNFYISEANKDQINDKREELKLLLNQEEFTDNIKKLSITQRLKIAVLSHFIYCLAYGKANFEHINPLIQRIESRSSFIEKTIRLSSTEQDWKLVNIISFKQCNSEAKKMLPLLIAKQLYDEHKNKMVDKDEINSTVHLIIDEAHNILSSQSTREEESWKDYRLEVFEEIIKEGRKFGFFITVASQRPYDISPTIVSQLHNYFIHRLVNDQDLRMIANTVNSLDSVSRNQIPALAPGQCIITGTSFEMPLLIQIDKLSTKKSPTSENPNLIKLWTNEEEVM